MPKYYLTPFPKWSKLSSITDSIKGQCLWYNKLRYKGWQKSVFCSNLFAFGMWFVHDLFENGKLILFETLKHRGASEIDRIIWCVVVRCVREIWNVDSICREQHDMPFQLSTGVKLGSGFINIEKVTQKNIKILLVEEKLNSLRANDYKYRLKHESVLGFPSSNE